MTNSESLKNIIPALVKAQSEMGKAVKGAENPFFHSDYADLPSVMEVVKEPLNNNGIAILQSVDQSAVRTILLHTTGEWISSGGTNIVSARPNDPQAQGSAITYAKRYDLQSLLFVPTTDDDGEKAVDRKPDVRTTVEKTLGFSPRPTRPQKNLDDLDLTDFTDGKPTRDTLGHTYCTKCGKVVSKKVEEFSVSKFGKILCMDCQKAANV